MRKSTRLRRLFVNVALCLILVGPGLLTPFFIGQQTAWAAAAYTPPLEDPLTGFVKTIGHIIEGLALIIETIISKDLIGWSACLLSAGIVECPNAANAKWGFECSAISNGSISPLPTPTTGDNGSPLPTPTTGPVNPTPTLLPTPTTGPVNPTPILLPTPTAGDHGPPVSGHGSAYKQALNAPDTKIDWLSGDVPSLGPDPHAAEGNYPSGHLIYTYAADTTDREGVKTLRPLTLGLGFFLIGPLFMVVGYQFLMAAWKLNSPSMMANAIDGFGRVMLAAVAIGISYQITEMLIGLANTASYAMVLLHQKIGFPQTTINGHGAVSYSIDGDTPQSFRGLVMPMSLWGCVLDDFLGIIATRVVNALSAMIPIIGGVLGLAGKITEIVVLLEHLGEFILFLLSVTIWGQTVIRIILINYYIILAPIAFACWGLPGQTGSQVLKMWFKGITQLLFVQALQLFILTTLPSLMPDFGYMAFPTQNDSHFDVMNVILVQLPVLITTMAAVRAPKILMGVSAIQTVAEAGSMAGKAVGGVAATVYGIVNH